MSCERKWFFVKGLIVLWTFVAFSICPDTSLYAKVFLTRDEALTQAFPAADKIERKTLFLSEDEAKRVEGLSRTRLEFRMFTYYVAVKNNEVSGYAFLGSHVVRTKPEVYMIVINPEGSLRKVEILAFYEPEEYLPSKIWFNQFQGRILGDSLMPKRGISPVSGATLSVNGLTAEVRMILAIFKIKILKGA